MSRRYEVVVAETMPTVSTHVRRQVENDLEEAERHLREMQRQVEDALAALWGAHAQRHQVGRAAGLGSALALANSPGASGPLGSQAEKVLAAMTRVQTTLRVADALAPEVTA